MGEVYELDAGQKAEIGSGVVYYVGENTVSYSNGKGVRRLAVLSSGATFETARGTFSFKRNGEYMNVKFEQK